MHNRRLIPLFIVLGLIAAGARFALQAADTTVYFVTKGMEYAQTNASGPILNGTNGYVFSAEVHMTATNSVLNASLQPPAALPLEPLTLSTSQTKLELKHKYNSQTKLDQHYPNGAYVFGINGKNDGWRQVVLQVFGNNYPAAPFIQNYPSLQTLNPNGYCQINWSPFPGGTAYDYVQLRLEDLSGKKLFETPDIDNLGGLDGTATRTLIGPGRLLAGQSIRATLLFQKAVDMNIASYPGAMGEAAYFAQTMFYPFTTAAPAPDVKTYEISKATKWIQTGPNSLAFDLGQEYVFQATVQANSAGTLGGATLMLPPNTNSPQRTLQPQPGGTTSTFTDTAPTAGQLNSFYSSGTYTQVFSTFNDGGKSLSLPLPADAYPPVPRIANFSALQMINVSHPFIISWDPWVGGTANDFIHVRIEDHNFRKIYETPDLGQPGFLDGRATNTVVPAGALDPGQALEIHVTFIRLNAVDTTSYAGVLGVSEFQARTKMQIQTVASDVKAYSIFKGIAFTQTDPGEPVAVASNAYRFQTQVECVTSHWVISAIVTTPSGTQQALPHPPGTAQLGLSVDFPDLGALDAAYPNGAYSLDINTANDGLKQLSLLTPFDQYPNPPHLINFAEAQSLDSSLGFTAIWDTFVGGSFIDFIQFQVRDLAGNTVFATPGFGPFGALNGFSTFATIPAGTLNPNQIYTATLVFKKLSFFDNVTYPGALGTAGYSATTQFRLVTSGTGNPPVLKLARVSPENEYQVSFAVVPGLFYRLEGSSNLVDWLPLFTNSVPTNSLQWLDSTPHSPFFYRAVVLP